MKVIQTHYNGYFFRSRTEARWAVFFDVLKEQWRYEVEGYELDGDLYLPDFWLPRLECHIEIKGQSPTTDEIRKCRKLQFFTGYDVAIFHGLPMENDGILFGWSDDNGGEFIESPAVWVIEDGLIISDYPDDSPVIEAAVRCAKQARFEYGSPLAIDIDYDNLPF